MRAWLITFALTLAVETAVAYPLLGLAVRPRRARLVAIVLANVLTHPVVYTLAAQLVPRSLLAIPLLEIGATVIEALVYRGCLGRVGRPMLLPAVFASCFANALSFAVSLVFWHFAGESSLP